MVLVKFLVHPTRSRICNYYTQMIYDLKPYCQCMGTAGKAVDSCATAADCDWCTIVTLPILLITAGFLPVPVL